MSLPVPYAEARPTPAHAPALRPRAYRPRRPHDRRQRDLPVLLDLRSKHERRQGDRREAPAPGRRSAPQPPPGIDVYA